MDPQVIAWAQKIWDYHHMHHTLQPADCMLVLGSHDVRVASRAAELYHQGMAPYIVCSGGLGRLTDGWFAEPEAVLFARIAEAEGVPRSVIFTESNSTNTGENIHLSQQLLQQKGLEPQSFLLVQKPYMERRTWATFMKVWPGKKAQVTSPQYSMLEYPNEDISLEQVIHIMLGDLQRIKLYPARGFQIEQPIPDDVWDAFEALVARGYNQQLIA